MRVKPVEEEVEGLGVVAAPNYSPENVKQLHDVLSHSLSLLHRLGIHREQVLNLRSQLVKVA